MVRIENKAFGVFIISVSQHISFPTSLIVIRTFAHIRIYELGSCIPSQHVHDAHLSPFVHVNEQSAQFAEVFVNQIDSLWANCLKSLNGAASNQLFKNIYNFLI